MVAKLNALVCVVTLLLIQVELELDLHQKHVIGLICLQVHDWTNTMREEKCTH